MNQVAITDFTDDAAFIGGGGLGELITAGMATFNFPQLIAGAVAVGMPYVHFDVTRPGESYALALDLLARGN